jgi:hypothetical protein
MMLRMSLGLILLVLFAAALHAAWNAIVKSSPDKSSDVVLVAVGAALIATATLPFVAIPATQLALSCRVCRDTSAVFLAGGPGLSPWRSELRVSADAGGLLRSSPSVPRASYWAKR